MRRFQSIAALLMLFVMMPLPRACAARLSSGNVQQKCCKPHIADTCCEGSKKLCSATQAPADATLYPGQSGLPLLAAGIGDMRLAAAVACSHGCGIARRSYRRLEAEPRHAGATGAAFTAWAHHCGDHRSTRLTKLP
jgi:hypothetical protein